MTADIAADRTIDAGVESPSAAIDDDLSNAIPFESEAIKALRQRWQRNEPLSKAAWFTGVDLKTAKRLAKAWRARGLRPQPPDPEAFAEARPPRIPDVCEARPDGRETFDPATAQRCERHRPAGPNPTRHGATERERRAALKERVDRLLAELPRPDTPDALGPSNADAGFANLAGFPTDTPDE